MLWSSRSTNARFPRSTASRYATIFLATAGRAIGIPLLLFLFIDQSQFMVLSGGQLGGFDQYALDMLVALFRTRCAQDRVCGTLFFSAESAIADRLLNRPKARYVPGGDGSHTGNGSEELDPLRQQRSSTLPTSIFSSDGVSADHRTYVPRSAVICRSQHGTRRHAPQRRNGNNRS